MRAYKARNGKTQYMPAFSAVEDAMADGTTGFCLACGAEQDGVEPDARKYHCEGCGAMKVYGAEQLLIMGLVHDDAARNVPDSPSLEDTAPNEHFTERGDS